MALSLGQISVFVADYDEAITYYCQRLGFVLVSDQQFATKRWVVIAPSTTCGAQFLLVQPTTSEQQQLIGAQGGGKVWLFLNTDDFETDYQRLLANGVKFLEQPRHESYGSVVVFEDLYGNKWDLIQRKES